MKMARCIMELERIKGIQNGGDRKSNGDNLNLKYSQKDLAEDLHISQRQLSDYKKLLNLIPELQQMVENGSMKATVGYKIWAKMPQEEQEKFFNDIELSGHQRVRACKDLGYRGIPYPLHLWLWNESSTKLKI